MMSTSPDAGTVDYKLEVVDLPVSDVDRAKQFYVSLGWREDADFPIRDDFRIVQMTPPGSAASVHFGTGLTAAEPGSYTGVMVVYDIEAAHADLVARGVDVSEIFHGPGRGFDRFNDAPLEAGRDPDGASYNSFATFSDPDGNRWVLQEIRTRLPGR
jgi:catechol 2,3-dioxygenase-like lactoylglutathione lyase family enzyme